MSTRHLARHHAVWTWFVWSWAGCTSNPMYINPCRAKKVVRQPLKLVKSRL